MASMLNDFSLDFNTEETGHTITNDISTINEIGSTPATSEHILHHLEITTEEVLKAINDMKTNKCPDLIIYIPKLWKRRNSKLLTPSEPYLIYPYDKVLSLPTGRLIMSPQFKKKKGDRNTPGNYRPITLTSVVGKMLESIIRDKVVAYLKSHSLIRDWQDCFRNKRSCLSNLLTFYNDIFLAHGITRSWDIVDLDFQKAFDKVPYIDYTIPWRSTPDISAVLLAQVSRTHTKWKHSHTLTFWDMYNFILYLGHYI